MTTAINDQQQQTWIGSFRIVSWSLLPKNHDDDDDDDDDMLDNYLLLLGKIFLSGTTV
jgi:hypothetical protein